MQEIPEIVTSIKQAAELTGLSEDTLRYYERVGLLPYAERKENGHRHYTRHQIHHDHIGREIAKLQETQKIIEYKLKNFRKLTEEPDLSDPNCDPHSNLEQ